MLVCQNAPMTEKNKNFSKIWGMACCCIIWSSFNVSNVKIWRCLYVCVCTCEFRWHSSIQERRGLRESASRRLWISCEYWSGKLSDAVKINWPETRGHKGHVQKSQSYYDKDIFIYVYIQYFHILKSIIWIIQRNNKSSQ